MEPKKSGFKDEFPFFIYRISMDLFDHSNHLSDPCAPGDEGRSLADRVGSHGHQQRCGGSVGGGRPAMTVDHFLDWTPILFFSTSIIYTVSVYNMLYYNLYVYIYMKVYICLHGSPKLRWQIVSKRRSVEMVVETRQRWPVVCLWGCGVWPFHVLGTHCRFSQGFNAPTEQAPNIPKSSH